jgi:hypothetical protein
MLDELLTRDISELTLSEMEEHCTELEEAFADALKDDVEFEVLSEIWKRLRELREVLQRTSGI